MTQSEPWTCPSCNTAVSTPYCPGCGERLLRAHELTLRGLFDLLVRAFTSIDGRLIRSVGCLVSRPGFLTVAYLQGRRKPYVGPVALFLMANVLFFATESLTGGKVFTTPLDAPVQCTIVLGPAEGERATRPAAFPYQSMHRHASFGQPPHEHVCALERERLGVAFMMVRKSLHDHRETRIAFELRENLRERLLRL